MRATFRVDESDATHEVEVNISSAEFDARNGAYTCPIDCEYLRQSDLRLFANTPESAMNEALVFVRRMFGDKKVLLLDGTPSNIYEVLVEATAGDQQA